MAVVNFDMSQFREFFQRMDKAAKGDLREELETYLEAVGFDFLRVVQDEIVRRKVVDTRLLLSRVLLPGKGNRPERPGRTGSAPGFPARPALSRHRRGKNLGNALPAHGGAW